MEPDDVAAGLYGRIFAIAAGVGRKRLGGEGFEGDGIAKKAARVNRPVKVRPRTRRRNDDGCGPFGRLVLVTILD